MMILNGILNRGSPDKIDPVSEVPPTGIWILMRIQHIDGSPLPAKMIDKKHMIAFSNQYTGEQPHNVEILALTEICYTFKENVVLAIVAGRLMSAVTWDEVPIIVSCTIASNQKVESIVRMREKARMAKTRIPWGKKEALEDNEPIQEIPPSLVVSVKSTRNSEVMRNIDQCLLQQKQLSKLVTDLSEQLNRYKSSEPPNVGGVDYSIPEILRPIYNQQIPSSRIQVKTELDIGTFSGSDPVPQDELTFEQWRSDVIAYQHQFPEYALLPAVCKSIQGEAKSVLRSLVPDFDIDQAINTLSREYEGIASSNIVIKQFYKLCQEPKEKVQVFSVRL